jgi:DNA-binding transcriptional ArsR family regulator
MDAQLRALAGQTRRQILELVREHELAAGEIAAHFDVTRPAISQHLAVRADSTGLVGLKEFVDRFWTTGLSRLKHEAEAEASRRPRA